MELRTELSRSALRYECYAMREQGKCNKEHQALIKSIEKLENFDGWENFALTWDFVVGPSVDKPLVQPLQLRWRKFGEQRTWERTVERLATKPTKAPRIIGSFKKGK